MELNSIARFMVRFTEAKLTCGGDSGNDAMICSHCADCPPDSRLTVSLAQFTPQATYQNRLALLAIVSQSGPLRQI